MRLCLITIFLAQILSASDWPQWRGPTRSGIWSESLPATLPANPKTLWKKEIGTGYAGPSVTQNKLFILDRLAPTNNRPDTERLLCFDAKTGENLWTHAYTCPIKFKSGYENGPRSTPTVDGNYVFALGAMGNFYCADINSSQIIWSHDLVKEFNAVIPDWGMVNSPLIDHDTIFIQAGATNGAVMAFDKKTGRELWRSLEFKPGYSPLSIIEAGGKRQLIAWTTDHLCSLNPDSGKVHWTIPRKLRWDQAIATPLFDPVHRIIVIASDREGALGVQLDADKPAAHSIWDNMSFSSLHAPFIMLDSHIYGLNHNGDFKTECGEFRCVDPTNGKVLWKETSLTKLGTWAHATTTYNSANKLFYITTDQGELILAKADPNGYKEIARTQILGKSWTHPAYSDQKIYWRAENSLICVSLD